MFQSIVGIGRICQRLKLSLTDLHKKSLVCPLVLLPSHEDGITSGDRGINFKGKEGEDVQ